MKKSKCKSWKKVENKGKLNFKVEKKLKTTFNLKLKKVAKKIAVKVKKKKEF